MKLLGRVFIMIMSLLLLGTGLTGQEETDTKATEEIEKFEKEMDSEMDDAKKILAEEEKKKGVDSVGSTKVGTRSSLLSGSSIIHL